MHNILKRGFLVGAIDDLNIDSSGDNTEIVFATPVRLRRVGFIATTAVANAAGVVLIKLRRRPVVGADANHVELGSFQVTDTTTRAAGSYTYKDLHIDDADGETAEDGTLRFEAPSSNISPVITGDDPWVIPMGQSLELDMGSADLADSGAGQWTLEYDELPMTGPYAARTNIFRDVTNNSAIAIT